jgi:hypothetical protein
MEKTSGKGKKMQVEIVREILAGRDGVSIYTNGGLTAHVAKATDLLKHLTFIDNVGEFKISYRGE